MKTKTLLIVPYVRISCPISEVFQETVMAGQQTSYTTELYLQKPTKMPPIGLLLRSAAVPSRGTSPCALTWSCSLTCGFLDTRSSSRNHPHPSWGPPTSPTLQTSCKHTHDLMGLFESWRWRANTLIFVVESKWLLSIDHLRDSQPSSDQMETLPDHYRANESINGGSNAQ